MLAFKTLWSGSYRNQIYSLLVKLQSHGHGSIKKSRKINAGISGNSQPQIRCWVHTNREATRGELHSLLLGAYLLPPSVPDSVPLLQPPPISGTFTTFPASKLLPAGTNEQQRFHEKFHVMAEMQAHLPRHLFLLPCQRLCLTCHSLFSGQALPFQHQQPLKVPLPPLFCPLCKTETW